MSGSLLCTKLLPSWSPVLTRLTSGVIRLLTYQPVSVLQVCSISKKTYVWPEIKEADIEEEFMRGGGPGGQSVAKTNNCVQLKHIPTGIVVKSHDTRSQSENRKKARERLAYHLDILINKENSFDAQSRRESALKKKAKLNKNKQRLELKKAFKEREGLD